MQSSSNVELNRPTLTLFIGFDTLRLKYLLLDKEVALHFNSGDIYKEEICVLHHCYTKGVHAGVDNGEK